MSGKIFDKGRIIAKFRLKHCDISEVNKYDPKRLTIRNTAGYKKTIIDGRDEEYVLAFEDEKLTIFTANFLNRNKKDIQKLEFALIIRILHQAENDLLPLKQQLISEK